MTRLGVLLATVGGAGYFPFAPGTVGSAAGVVVFALTRHWPVSWQLLLAAVIAIVGVWASDAAARHFGKKDPSPVVIDEVAGQLVTLLAIGAGAGWGLDGLRWTGIAAGFFLFRALDIVKPWPARQFENLPGGIGIMADDLMAGVYGNLILRAAVALLPGVL
jgi:phosphatidylglycerophosphatase A